MGEEERELWSGNGMEKQDRQAGKERKGRYIMNDTVFEFFSFLFFSSLFFFVRGPDTGGTLFFVAYCALGWSV